MYWSCSKKVISKHRVDFVSGNINSYARLLNGPQQLDKIQTYNDLAATMAELKRDKSSSTCYQQLIWD
jgi:hypothetical protein